MKNFCFLLCLLSITCTSAFAVEENSLMINEGPSLTLESGVLIQRSNTSYYLDQARTSKHSEKHTAPMAQILGRYQYQTIDELYGHGFFSYAKGHKNTREKDDQGGSKYLHSYRLENVNFEGALGWTFYLMDNLLLSPFIAIGYRNLKERKRLEEIDEEVTIRRLEFSAWYATVGANGNYLITDDFAIAFMLSLGLPINPHIKHNNISIGKEDSNATDLYRYKGKRKMFFDVSIAPIYYTMMWDIQWKLGLMLNYKFIPIEAKNIGGSELFMAASRELDHDLHQFAISLILGCIF